MGRFLSQPFRDWWCAGQGEPRVVNAGSGDIMEIRERGSEFVERLIDQLVHQPRQHPEYYIVTSMTMEVSLC
jgi:hypothetical protein